MSFKKVIACGLIATLVLTSNGPAGTALAAKKMSLSKKTATVTDGKTTTLKVKNASKTVKWSTSNKKVATVTASGKKKATAKIKGVSAGKATITAKVGSKKLSCKVTVKKAKSQIKSVAIDPLDTSCVVLTMKKATPVNVSDLVVAKKNYKEGAYNYKPTIKTIASADQITYRIYLDSTFTKGDWIKVTYNKNDSVEKQYLNKVYGYTTDEYIKKGELTKENASQYFDNMVGTVKYSLANGSMPAGMVLNTKRGVIKGIPTTAGSYVFKIKATDELGRSATATLTYNIYDETVLFAPEVYTGVRLDDYLDAVKGDTTINVPGETYYSSATIHPYGGSGKYTYTLDTPDIANVRLSTDVKDENGQAYKKNASTSELLIPYEITEGEHLYAITVTDSQNSTLSTKMFVHVSATAYYNTSGVATDTIEAALSGNELYFYPVGSTSADSYISKREFEKITEDGYVYYDVDFKDYTARIGSSDDANALMGNKKGTYSTELPAGEYIVKIHSDADGIDYQMNDHIVVSKDDIHPVKAPIRFYSVNALAKYANGNPVANSKVYFEMKDRQYETSILSNMSFNVTTDANGTFVASLPANKYAAYIIDSDGNRQYFTQDIEVTDKNIEVSNFALSIERYTVEGAVSRTSGGDNEPSLMKNTTLRLYNAKGSYSEIETDESGNYKVGLPGNSTYIVKVQISNVWHTIGTIAVTNQNLSGQNFIYNFHTEIAYAPALTLGTDMPFAISGGAIAVAKFDVTESGNSYKFTMKGNYVDKMSIYVLDSSGYVEQSSYNTYTSSAYMNANLSKGTYYVFAIPEITSSDDSSKYSIASGDYVMKVEKN